MTLRELLEQEKGAIGKFQKLQQSFIYSVKNNAKRHGKWVSGRSVSLLKGDVQVDDDRIIFHFQVGDGSVQNAQQFGQLEDGRRLGKVPKGFSDIIYEWSKQRGISFTSEKERRRFAFLTARKIANEGTEQYKSATRIDIIDSLYRQFTNNADRYVNMFKKDVVMHEIDNLDKLLTQQ